MKSQSSRGRAKQPDPRVQRYLDALPPAARSHLEKLRRAIRAAAPGAVDAFSYGILAFAIDGKPFIWYAAWKQHSSVYPISESIARALASEIENYEFSGRATIRFRLDEPLPTALVGRLVKARLAEMRKKKKKS